MSDMWKLRENRHNRVYHLISRIARRSFYLDDGGHEGLTLADPAMVDFANPRNILLVQLWIR